MWLCLHHQFLIRLTLSSLHQLASLPVPNDLADTTHCGISSRWNNLSRPSSPMTLVYGGTINASSDIELVNAAHGCSSRQRGSFPTDTATVVSSPLPPRLWLRRQ
ncbi:hypothetical protein C8R45DRAFT_1025983 [Mycena sanguinolenta]|nr:hypothetical protein C8R45DRAFT_1025983 [Mycena sanguinolenta]